MIPSELINFKNSKKIIALTAWDSITGSLAELAGADIVLVGDSLGMVALGYKTTLPVTLRNMVDHTNAVCRGFSYKLDAQPLLICDLPFLSYQCGEDKAVENAGKIIKDTPAKGVKLEGAEPETLDVISRLIRMGIPVMGHVGLTPQNFLNQGLKQQGDNHITQEKIKQEAKSLEKLGCFAIVLEHVPNLLAKDISENLKIPTIGIGAGNYCDGQIRVTADLLGLTDKQPPFCEPLIDGKNIFKDKLKKWIEDERLN
tara:strand:+ start:2266 stop:3036 length:771 start_codon:yes stop_codon:yes gene_type:complete